MNRATAAELEALRPCWEELPPDGYLKDGGRYRFRRHGNFVVDGDQVRAMLPDDGSPVLAVLDSDHSRDHVLAELELFAPMITAGSYLIVEDTNINGRPVSPDFGPGPAEAVEEFFAVAVEAFFVAPAAMRAEEPAMYGLLAGFFQQDPAAGA